MSWFVVGYYTLLLAGSCGAAYFGRRSEFMLLFLLTLVSLVLGIVGGVPALRMVAGAAAAMAVAAMAAYGFREFLVQIAEGDIGAPLRALGPALRCFWPFWSCWRSCPGRWAGESPRPLR